MPTRILAYMLFDPDTWLLLRALAAGLALFAVAALWLADNGERIRVICRWRPVGRTPVPLEDERRRLQLVVGGSSQEVR